MYVQLCSVPSSHAPGPALQSRRAWCTLTPHVQDYRPSLFLGQLSLDLGLAAFVYESLIFMTPEQEEVGSMKMSRY